MSLHDRIFGEINEADEYTEGPYKKNQFKKGPKAGTLFVKPRKGGSFTLNSIHVQGDKQGRVKMPSYGTDEGHQTTIDVQDENVVDRLESIQESLSEFMS